MTGSNGYHVTWRVRDRGEFAEQLRALVARAATAGLSAELAGALRTMMHSLGRDPTGWGDPMNNMAHSDGQYFRRYDRLLTVTYVVYPSRGLVFLRDVVASPGSPLEGA